MANTLTRFGRPQDRPALLEEAPIIGHRIVTDSSRNALFAHKNENFEITYMASGTLEWLINDELIVTRQNDILITFPDDKLALLNGTFMVSEAYFMQVDLKHEGFLSQKERDLFTHKLKNIESRKVSLSTDRSILFSKLVNEHDKHDSYSEGLCRGWLYEILTMVVRRSEGWEAKGSFDADTMFKKNLLTYLEAHLSETIKVLDIANHFGYSESHFRVLFKQVFAVPPVDFIRQFRIDSAQRLIREDRISITDIAYKVGFTSSQYFSHTFKKELGISPREYRKALKTDAGRIHDTATSIHLMDMHFPNKA